MATRSDIVVRWDLSPRLVVVDAPSTEVTIQDIHDTLRDLSDEPDNMVYPQIIETAGGENLGGGVTVGLTATLFNARLGFIARKLSTASGSITAADVTGRTITDAGATFVSDGIEPGASVWNTTDGSRATALVVVSETEIVTDILGDGVDNQWDLGDLYEVQNITQCQVDGGNLVAVDELGADIDPIFPTMGTQVVRTSSSSATLQEIPDIQDSIADAVTEQAHMAPAYDDAAGQETIRALIWLARRHLTQPNPIAMSLTWRNPDGSVLFSVTDASPGVTLGSVGQYEMVQQQALASDTSYSVDVQVTDSRGVVASTRSVVTS